jgi:hypothetical protein
VLILVILVTVFKVERIQHISSIPCCNGDFQREDDLVQWLQQNQLEPGRYLSNTPLPLMYTDLPVFAAPKGLSDWQSLLEQGDTVYLIVFDADDPAEFYRDNLTDYYYLLDFDPLELADLADLKVIADVDRGRVYQLQPRG